MHWHILSETSLGCTCERRVKVLYLTLLGRSPDHYEFSTHRQMCVEGISFTEHAQKHFVETEEYRSRWWIHLLYHNHKIPCCCKKFLSKNRFYRISYELYAVHCDHHDSCGKLETVAKAEEAITESLPRLTLPNKLLTLNRS